jgi:8-oxo-dGTP pyrophosphatase MutT (NUDIX family)
MLTLALFRDEFNLFSLQFTLSVVASRCEVNKMSETKKVACIVLILDDAPEKRILLVEKSGSWFLPGGKIEAEEAEIECLRRELTEELPYASCLIDDYFREYMGTTPNTKMPANVKVWLGTWLRGSIAPANEIGNSKWVTAAEAASMNVSQISRDIIYDLQAEGLL